MDREGTKTSKNTKLGEREEGALRRFSSRFVPFAPLRDFALQTPPAPEPPQ